MDRQIPLYFDSVIIDSPFQGISDTNPNIGRLKVRVFTKYGNRNGSYITEAVANQLIESATKGSTPVVGFFDPESKSWASHSGPTLANAYGYVENFLGWEPFTDTDGVTRDYAVFSVILFTDYFEEAQKIFGQNQSMELDPASITGDWTLIDNEEFYVYKTAKMLGFCVIGEHEPCFSVSSFFSKNDDIYNSQYEKFSSLLSNLKTQVEEAEKNQKGGEQQMNEFENQEVVEVENEVQVEDSQVIDEFQAEAETTEEVVTTEEETVEDESEAETAKESNDDEGSAADESVENDDTAADEFESLQNQFNELQNSYNELQSNYSAAEGRIAELEQFQSEANTTIEALRAENATLQSSLQAYEAQAVNMENERKENLIEKYKKVMNDEEISPIQEKVNDFSYEELESKLAIAFANKKIDSSEEKKIPLPENKEESQFALLMKKYRKN